MSKNNKSFYLYFVIIIGLLLLTVWIGTLRVQNTGYTRGQFIAQLENNEVAMVNICPNKDTPTGSLEITLKSGEERTLYVTDVTEMETVVRSYGLDPRVESVPEESWSMMSGTDIIMKRKKVAGRQVNDLKGLKNSVIHIHARAIARMRAVFTVIVSQADVIQVFAEGNRTPRSAVR